MRLLMMVFAVGAVTLGPAVGQRGEGDGSWAMQPALCRDARVGLAWYRARTHEHQLDRDATRLAGPGPRARGQSCAFVRAAADTWRARARAARERTARFTRRMRIDPRFAIAHVWRDEGRATVTKAYDVVDCETGGRWSVSAANGQYRGLFQMGSWERWTFGHGTTPRVQAEAALRYFRLSGWRPWSCA